jgi:hypothetical protein
MVDDAVAQADQILAAREAVLLQELARIRDARRGLERVRPASEPPRPTTKEVQQRLSVRTLLLNLLEEADRDWSANEVLAEYERRGTPIHGADPSNALRAAISDANKAKQIVRTAVGRYKSARFEKVIPPGQVAAFSDDPGFTPDTEAPVAS